MFYRGFLIKRCDCVKSLLVVLAELNMRPLVTSGTRSRWLQKMVDHPASISIVLWVAIYCYGGFILEFRNSEHTRISEHSLMPGLVAEHFDLDNLVLEFVRGISNSSDRQNFVCERFRRADIPCYRQEWSTRFNILNASGVNVYGIVRSSRAIGAEASLIVVDVHQDEAVAIAMAYANFAARQVYWARDLFFIFVDGGSLAMDAWLSAYHLTQQPALRVQQLDALGGYVVAGVVFKTHDRHNERSKTLELEINQLNGQLPNLDVFNAIVRILAREKFNIHPTVFTGEELEKGGLSNWPYMVPFRAMYVQAFVGVQGQHSVFDKYGVQGLSMSVPRISSFPLRESARILEALSRSLNNVLERLHQSYFLYILTSVDHFVSVAYFMPIIGGLAAPLLIYAYREWVLMPFGSLLLPFSYVLHHAIGAALFFTARYYFSYVTRDSMTDSRTFTLITLLPFGLFIRPNAFELRSTCLLLLLECALVACSVSLLNFSLALVFIICSVPALVLFTRPCTARKFLLRAVFVFLLHPISLYVVFVTSVRPILLLPTARPMSDLSTVWDSMRELMREHLLYGSNVFTLLCAFVLPVWNVLLSVAFSTSEILPLCQSAAKEKPE